MRDRGDLDGWTAVAMTVLAMRSGRMHVLLAAAGFALGCGSESAERVVASAPVDTVRMQLSWEVSEGNVYVSDRAAIKIWVFDSAGRSLDAVGRKGEGPGEFGFTVDPPVCSRATSTTSVGRSTAIGDPRARVASRPDQNAACIIRRTHSRTGLRARPSITSTIPFPRDA